jgi:uncharacterized protein YbjT (DUF2867 family)
MAKRVYAVAGASGQIGSVITQQLLKQGHKVKAIGRDQKKLDLLKAKGAEVVRVESFEKEPVLTRAFEGAEALFALLPPHYGADSFTNYQDTVGEAIKSAVQKNNIDHVVNLSSLGAQEERTGPIKGLRRQEERLNTLKNVQVLHFRPAYFMENLLWAIPSIHKTGVFTSLLSPDIALPMVSTDDIGSKIAECLNRLDFKGHTVFEFGGPRPVTMVEVAKVLGKAIGKPDLKYNQQNYEEGRQLLVAGGVKPQMADLMIEMYRAFNEGKCLPQQKLTADHLGKTTIDQFAKIFERGYKQYSEIHKVMV